MSVQRWGSIIHECRCEYVFVQGGYMKKRDSLVLRNSDGKEKWDKPIVNTDKTEDYYKVLPDKRLFDMARVILIEEDDAYVIIKNIWKYDENDLRKCRKLNGELFNVEDIEFVKVGARDYTGMRMAVEGDIPSNIIIKDIFDL